MPIEGTINSLYLDYEQTKPLFPRTKVKAVSDDNGKGLNALLDDKASKDFVTAKIAEAQLGGGSGDIDLSGFATKDELNAVNDRIPTTPAQIGAAPAGYGLGEPMQMVLADSETDLYNKLDAILATLPDGTSKFVRINCFAVFGTGYTFNCELHNAFNGYATLRGGSYNGLQFFIYKDNGNWFVEWVNPPMQLGVEYRTTERNNGSPVYAKRVSYSLGAIDGTNTSVDTSIPHGISNFAYLVRANCVKDFYVLPFIKDNGGFTSITNVNATNIVLRVYRANWAAATWLVDLYYVKY